MLTRTLPLWRLSAAALCLSAAGLAHAADFTLASPEIKADRPIGAAQVYAGFGCTGGNSSPSIAWLGEPAGAKSFALTMYDPDAPTGSGWWHWVVYDIPSSVHGFAAGAGAADGSRMPQGVKQGRTDFGVPGYGGPCPPPGDAPHRYIFTVYALNVPTLAVPADASAAMIGFMINAHKIGQASFTGRYGR